MAEATSQTQSHSHSHSDRRGRGCGHTHSVEPEGYCWSNHVWKVVASRLPRQVTATVAQRTLGDAQPARERYH